MTRNELLRRFPNASAATLAANADSPADCAGAVAELECGAGDGALAARQGEARATERVHIRFVSVRKRLLDPDNLCEKWTLDALRFAGILRGDEPDKITLETTQRKAAKDEAEMTIIELYK